MMGRLLVITMLFVSMIGTAVAPVAALPLTAPVISPAPSGDRLVAPEATVDPNIDRVLAPSAKPGVPVPPVITSFSQYSGAPGTSVTIYGSGFGAQKRDSIVWFNGYRAHFTSWTDTVIVFDVPADVPSGYVGIENDAGCSNGFYFIPFDTPSVTAVSATTGAVGTDITIDGSLFGAVQGSGYVSFNGTPGDVKSWTDTQIVVGIPQGATAGYVGVVQNELTSNGTLFTPYYQPKVGTLSTQYALVGDTVTITGLDFGSDAGQVTLNGQALTSATWSDTSVTFVVPDGARSGYCGVVRDGVVSNGVYLFVAPRIDTASAWWAAPGSQVTVNGRGFGSSDGESFGLLFGGARIGSDSWSNNAVTFTVPAGASSGYIGFTDHLGAATSNGLWLLVLDRATITSVSATDVPTGSTFSVQGTGFGTAGFGELRLNGTPLTIVSWTETEIVAIAPEIPAYGYLSVTKSGVDSNGMLLNVYLQENLSAGL